MYLRIIPSPPSILNNINLRIKQFGKFHKLIQWSMFELNHIWYKNFRKQFRFALYLLNNDLTLRWNKLSLELSTKAKVEQQLGTIELVFYFIFLVLHLLFTSSMKRCLTKSTLKFEREFEVQKVKEKNYLIFYVPIIIYWTMRIRMHGRKG